jgi:MinD-like ATPase involved in chromosome partitioning or flagellar assembly
VVVVLIAAAGAPWESAVLAALDARSDVVVLKRCVDVDDLLATAAAGQAEVALVGLDAPGFDVPAVDHLRRHGVRPVAVSPAGAGLDAGLARAARIGAGAVVPDDDLEGLVAAVRRPPPPPPPAAEASTEAGPSEQAPAPGGPGGRVVAVWGPAGAPGRTTVATGLAAVLATRRPTVLVDADPYGGSVAQVLGVLDEVSGLLAATRLAGNGTLAEGFAGIQRGLDERLSVVTGLPRPDRWTEVRSGTVEAVLGLARERGEVVVDTGFSLEEDPAGDYGARPGRNRLTLDALSAADEVVAVGTADPVGLSRLARGLVELREVLGPVPVRLLVNRMRPTLGWSEQDVASMVSGFARPVGLHFLPEDREAVDRALVTGRTLTESAPDSPLVRALTEVADAIAPAPGRATDRRRWLRRRRAAGARPR